MRRGGIAAVALVGIGAVIAGGIVLRSAGPEATGALGAQSAAQFEAPRGPADSGWLVTRVVDGDTIVVSRAGQRQRVRLIGIDTPESVRPDAPVECYGPEAADFATAVLQGREVVLESDPTQGDFDAYDRRLAYVWYAQDSGQMILFNAEAIQAGMAREYTYDDRYAWRDVFVQAEESARSVGRGLWGACTR